MLGSLRIAPEGGAFPKRGPLGIPWKRFIFFLYFIYILFRALCQQRILYKT